MSVRADPACHFSEHRASDWALDGDRTWQCGVCQPPSPALAKGGLVVHRNGKGQADYERVLAEVTGELTADETGRLADLEAVVERGLQTFVEVGIALGEIRDGRLYRADHATFEDYCRERWSMGRSHAYRMIDAAEVVKVVSPIGDIDPPSSEAVVRELTPLKGDPEQMREVWTKTVREHGPKPTARQVRVKIERKPLTLVGAGLGPELERAERRAQDNAILKLVTAANRAARRASREREQILGAIERRRSLHDVEVLALNVLFSIRDLQEIADAAMARLDDDQRAMVHANLAATGGTPTT